ncbi:MAG: type II toxin-antitoxin system RelE/ParE family toxin [bacterium]
MAEIKWTEEAVKWLDEKHNYIKMDSSSKADKVFSTIFDRLQLLKSFPELGYPNKSEKEGDIRVYSRFLVSD